MNDNCIYKLKPVKFWSSLSRDEEIEHEFKYAKIEDHVYAQLNEQQIACYFFSMQRCKKSLAFLLITSEKFLTSVYILP